MKKLIIYFALLIVLLTAPVASAETLAEQKSQCQASLDELSKTVLNVHVEGKMAYLEVLPEFYNNSNPAIRVVLMYCTAITTNMDNVSMIVLKNDNTNVTVLERCKHCQDLEKYEEENLYAPMPK
jgi:hypothetical protein